MRYIGNVTPLTLVPASPAFWLLATLLLQAIPASDPTVGTVKDITSMGLTGGAILACIVLYRDNRRIMADRDSAVAKTSQDRDQAVEKKDQLLLSLYKDMATVLADNRTVVQQMATTLERMDNTLQRMDNVRGVLGGTQRAGD